MVIRDPKLLPYYMNLETVAALCGVSKRTIKEYCRREIFKRGVHYTQPTRQRRFHRDPILAWINETSIVRVQVDLGKSNLDLSRSPELASEIAREQCLA